MKLFSLTSTLFSALFLTISAVSGQEPGSPECPLGKGWKFNIKFSDEFNGQMLDTARWWDFNPAWHGRKPSYFSRENVAVGDGMLQLTARSLKAGELSVENKVRGYDKFTTSSIKSKNRIRYGYFEARCKSMKAGVCNAFWLYDPLDPPEKYSEGSYSEEIDIFEIFGKPARADAVRKYFMTVHRMKTPYVESLVRTAAPLENKSASVTMPYEFYDDFHIYGFLWTPEEMIWYADGREVFSRKNDYFNSFLNIVLDCEIMEAWVGLPDPSDLPAVFYVDYVRVWQKN